MATRTQAWLLDVEATEADFAPQRWNTLKDTIPEVQVDAFGDTIRALSMEDFFPITKRRNGDSFVMHGRWKSGRVYYDDSGGFETIVLTGELTLWPASKPRFILDPEGVTISEHD